MPLEISRSLDVAQAHLPRLAEAACPQKPTVRTKHNNVDHQQATGGATTRRLRTHRHPRRSTYPARLVASGASSAARRLNSPLSRIAFSRPVSSCVIVSMWDAHMLRILKKRSSGVRSLEGPLKNDDKCAQSKSALPWFKGKSTGWFRAVHSRYISKWRRYEALYVHISN